MNANNVFNYKRLKEKVEEHDKRINILSQIIQNSLYSDKYIEILILENIQKNKTKLYEDLAKIPEL
jgi:hypothetical protein